MDTFCNLRGNQKIPFLLDFPVSVIKQNIWQQSFNLMDRMNSMRFIPSYVRLFIKDNKSKKEVNVEIYKEIIMFSKKNEVINLQSDQKIIFDDDGKKFIWYNDNKYYISLNEIKSSPYRPDYLYEILDNYNIELKNAKFYYESLVDVLESQTENYSSIKLKWPFLTLDEFNQAKNFKKYDESWYINYYNNNFNESLTEFWDDFNSLVKPYLETNKTYFISEELIQTQVVISKGDEGNNYISLKNIFKSFNTSLDIPFISVKYSDSTKIKIDSDFLNLNKLKDWTLGESAKKKEIHELNSENSKLIEPRGINFKVRQSKDNYATVTLYSNGRMIVKYFKDKNNSDSSIEYPSIIKKIIKTINDIPEAFLHEPKKIKDLENIKSFFNIDLIFKNYFDINDFDMINYESYFIREFLFSDLYYDIPSNNFITLVRKTITEKGDTTGAPKGSGIIFSELKKYDDYKVMIKRSSSFENASLIQILGMNSYSQLESVIFWLNLCFSLRNKNTETENIKKVNKNKEIKSTDIIFDARKCQGKKQPMIFPSDISEDKYKHYIREGSYKLDYKNNIVVCNSDEFKYPGFTSSGNVCCFIKDQRNTSKFLETYKPDDNFLVQPINLFYSKGKGKFPVLSKNGEYFYVKNKILEPLPQENKEKLISKEKDANEGGRTYMTKEISYNTFLINMNSIEEISIKNDGSLSCPVDSIIRLSSDGKFFISKKENKLEPTFYKNKYEIISLNQHIITTDKILPNRRVGILPDQIKKIFESLKMKDISFYRFGVNQGSDSFLQSISINIGKSVQEINKEIKKKLNYKLFLSLENGELPFLFDKNFKKFKSFLNDSKEQKSYIHYWDLVQYIFNVKIIIFDYFEQTIICHSNSEKIDKNQDTIFVLKIDNSYESIIAVDNLGIVKKIEMKEKSMLNKFYSFVCNPGPKLIVPDIKYQIIDSNTNKIRYFVLKDNFFMPFNEKSDKEIGPFPDIPIKSFSKRKPTAEKTLELAKKHKVEIDGQILKINIKNEQVVVGLLTSKYEVIPVRHSPKIPDLAISNYNYFPDAEKGLSKSSKKDKRMDFIFYKKQIEIMYHLLKYKYSQEYIKSNLSIKSFFDKFILWEEMSDDIFTNLKIKVSDCIAECKNICIKNENSCQLRARDIFKDYFIQRLKYEFDNNPNIKNGQISSQYEEIPENQIIFNDVNKVLEYLKKLHQNQK